MPTYKVNGKTYNIPQEKIKDFEATYPQAVVDVYDGGSGKGYELPVSKVSKFKSQFPKWSYDAPKVQSIPETAASKTFSGSGDTASSYTLAPEKSSEKGNAKPWRPTPIHEAFLGKALDSAESTIDNINAMVESGRRRVESRTDKGRARQHAGETHARMMGLSTSVLGLTPSASAGDGGGPGSAKPSNSPDSPVAYDVVKVGDKYETQWLLPDGTLTTDYAEASKAEYGARQARLRHEFERRMKANGLNPANKADVEEQSRRDFIEESQKEVDYRLPENEKKIREIQDKRAQEFDKSMSWDDSQGFWENMARIIGGSVKRGIENSHPVNKPVSSLTEDDRNLRNLTAENHFLNEARKRLETRKLKKSEGFMGGFWNIANNARNMAMGAAHTLTDVDLYGGGVMALQKASQLLEIEDKLKSGVNLSDSEVHIVYAAMLANGANQSIGTPHGYNAAQITVEMFPFMVQMMLNPASGLSQALVKRFGKTSLKRIALTVAGDIAESAVLANTLQAPATAANAMERYQGNPQIEAGEIEFDGSHRWGEAIAKAEGAATIENYTEMLGEHFGVISKFAGKMAAKGVSKIGGGKIVENVSGLISKVRATDWMKAVEKVENRAHWNGTVGEIMEEEAGIVLNSLTVGDNQLSDLVDADQQIDIVLGVGLFGGFVSGIKTIGYPIGKARAKSNLRQMEAIAGFRFGEDWEEIRNQIEASEENQLSDTIRSLINTHAKSKEQASALLKYAHALQRARGYELASANAKAEGILPPEVQNAVDSFEHGTDIANANNPTAMADARQLVERERQRVVEAMSDDFVADNLDGNDVVAALNSIGEDEELRRIVLDYLNARYAYEGMIQGVKTDIDSRIVRSDAEIDGRANRETGMIQPAVYGAEKKNVYIISGTVTMFDDGTGVDKENSSESIIIRDAETGKIEYADPEQFHSVAAGLDAQSEKEAAAEKIRQEMAQAAADNIDSTVDGVPGSTYTVLDIDADPIQITIVGSAVDESGNQIDGAVEIQYDEDGSRQNVSLTNLQDWVDAANQKRVEDYQKERDEQRKQDDELQRQAQESGLDNPNRRKDLMPDDYPMPYTNLPTRAARYIEGGNDGIGGTLYRDENGNDAIVIVAFDDGNYVGYFREYDEEGNPTERWSAKFQNESGDKTRYKAMMMMAQKLLPENHQLTEHTSVSTDGLRNLANQLKHGYELQYDENGNIITTEVKINMMARDNALGIADYDPGSISPAHVTNEEYMAVAKRLILYMEALGLTKFNIHWENGTLIVDHPILKRVKSASDSDASAGSSIDGVVGDESLELSALQRLPKDENGNPSFEQAESAEHGWDALVEFCEGDVDAAMELAEKTAENKRKALEKASKLKLEGETLVEMRESQRKKASILAKAQAEYELWQKMAAVKQSRLDAIRAEQEAEARRRAKERAEAQRVEQAAEEERLRQEKEEREGIPEMSHDTPENARLRGKRRIGPTIYTRQEPITEKVVGKEVTVDFNEKIEGHRPKGRLVVIEAAQGQASHMEGKQNPLFFIDEAQPKKRTDAESVLAEQKHAREMDPALITDGRDMVDPFRGAPTVNSRGEIIQGNHRMATLRYMYANEPESQKRYREYLYEHAAEFGFTPEQAQEIAFMEEPVLVNMIDVDDAMAIELGQDTGTSRETGGKERIDADRLAAGIGDKMGRFMDSLLRDDTEDGESLRGLIRRNGLAALKYLRDMKRISDRQYATAINRDGNLSDEGVEDLENFIKRSFFAGESEEFIAMFDALPAKAQSAVLAQIWRDSKTPDGEKLTPHVKEAVKAFYAMLSIPQFKDARNLDEAMRATEMWRRQTELGMDGEVVSNLERHSNFALKFAAMMKGASMRETRGVLKQMLDWVQGVGEDMGLMEMMDSEQQTESPAYDRTFAGAVRKVLGMDYKSGDVSPVISSGESIQNSSDKALDNSGGTEGKKESTDKKDIENGENGSADVAGGSQAGTSGEQGSGRNGRGGKQTSQGAESTDRGTGVADDSTDKANSVEGVGDRAVNEWFGPVYTDFEGKGVEAETYLRDKCEGVAKGALSYPGLSPIDLAWGDMKAGYMKIVIKHPEVVGKLQLILNDCKISEQSDNQVVLESDTHKVIVSKMKGPTPTDNWLLTAYEKKKKPVSVSSSDIETEPEGKRNGTATPQSELSSEDKDNALSSEKQADGEKSSEQESAKPEQQRELTAEDLDRIGPDSGIDESVIDGARDWLEGSRDPWAEMCYKTINDYVRNTGNNSTADSSDAGNPQLAGAESESAGRGTGEEGSAAGGVDREGGAADVAGGRESGENSQGDGGTVAGAESSGSMEDDSSDSGQNDNGAADTGGGRGNRGKRGNVRKPGGKKGSKRTSRDDGAGPSETAAVESESTAESDALSRTEESAQGLIDDALSTLRDIFSNPTMTARDQLNDVTTLLAGLGVNAVRFLGATAKLGCGLVMKGYCKYARWQGEMHRNLDPLLTQHTDLSDEQIAEFIRSAWDMKMTFRGQRKRISEWAAELEAEELKKLARMSIEEKRRLQKGAENTKVKVCDLDNIRETLPFLLPAQHEDVEKAERQMFRPEHADREHGYGKGYLFTNGTGTGKTYTGLGIAKRFIKQGKGRILIVTVNDTKISDWIKDAANLGIEAKQLPDTKSKGEGVVVTQYANLRQNFALLEDEFDLIIYDESHKLMENQEGTVGSTAEMHHMIAARDARAVIEREMEVSELGKRRRAIRDEIARLNELQDLTNRRASMLTDNDRKKLSESGYRTPEEIQEELKRKGAEEERLADEIEDKIEATLADDAQRRRAEEISKKTKTVFLSATPFNTPASLDYTEGYIFSYPEGKEGMKRRDRRNDFLRQNFGKSHRRNSQGDMARVSEGQIADPEAVEEEEIAFSNHLQNELQTMSGRMLDSAYDYSRTFPTFDMPEAQLVNSAMSDISKGPLASYFQKTLLDYNYSTAFWEIIKTGFAIPRIREHIALGRKVVVFHRRKASSQMIYCPFASGISEALKKGSVVEKAAAREFAAKYAGLLKWEAGLDYTYPQDRILNEFVTDEERAEYEKQKAAWIKKRDAAISAGKRVPPAPKLQSKRVGIFNGDQTASEKQRAVDNFNHPDSAQDVIVVQVQSGKEGISLHDTDGKHQRVMMSLALPQSPIEFIQAEGRIYRVGNHSDAIFEYPLLGIDRELYDFAMKINGRSQTSENLAMGSQSRGLRDSITRGALGSTQIAVTEGQGKGGKMLDSRQTQTATGFDHAVSNWKEWQEKEAGLPYDERSIPDPLGFKLMEWAGAERGETVMVAYAGEGSAARYVPASTKLIALETDSGKLARLAALLGGGGRKILGEEFMSDSPNQGTVYSIVNKADVVVIKTKTGTYNNGFSTKLRSVRDIHKALQHTEDSGRVVAIVPTEDLKGVGGVLNMLEEQRKYEGCVARTIIHLPESIFGQKSSVIIIDKNQEPSIADANAAKRPDIKDIKSGETVEETLSALRDEAVEKRVVDRIAKAAKRVKRVLGAFNNSKLVSSDRWGGKSRKSVHVSRNLVQIRFTQHLVPKSMESLYSLWNGISIKLNELGKRTHLEELARQWKACRHLSELSIDEFKDIYSGRFRTDAKFQEAQDLMEHVCALIEAATGKTPTQLGNIAEGKVENEIKTDMTLSEFKDIYKTLDSGSEELDALAERVFAIASQIKGLTFKMAGGNVFSGHNVMAHYAPAKNAIELNADMFNSPRTTDEQKAQCILHETIHAVTCWALAQYKAASAGERASMGAIADACRDIEEVFKAINNDSFRAELQAKSKLKDNAMYGLTDEYEMLAEMANPAFRMALKGKRLWRQLVNGIKKLFGIDVMETGEGATTAFEVLDKAINTILDNFDADAYVAYQSAPYMQEGVHEMRSLFDDPSDTESSKMWVQRSLFDEVETPTAAAPQSESSKEEAAERIRRIDEANAAIDEFNDYAWDIYHRYGLFSETAPELTEKLMARMDSELMDVADRMRGQLEEYYRAEGNTDEDCARMARDMASRVVAETTLRLSPEIQEEIALARLNRAQDMVSGNGQNVTVTASGELMTFQNAATDEASASSTDTDSQNSATESTTPEGVAPLRKLEPGEYTHVERQFTSTHEFGFTGKEHIESLDDVAYIFRSLEDYSIENVFAVLVKDGHATIVHLGMGGPTMSMADMTGLRVSLDAFGAEQIYLVHNHPSGNLQPSQADRKLLSVLENMCGDDIECEGVIIDVTSGRYSAFATDMVSDDFDENHRDDSHSSGDTEYAAIRVNRMERTEEGKDVSSLPVIRSSKDVASLVAGKRLGTESKISYLLLAHNNTVIGNLHTVFSEYAGNIEAMADEMVRMGVRHGAVAVIPYGNVEFTAQAIQNLKKEVVRRSANGVRLLDALEIESRAGYGYTSATDSGMVFEADSSYEEDGARVESADGKAKTSDRKAYIEALISSRGFVMSGLADVEVRVVKAPSELPFNINQKTTQLKKDVKRYARLNGIIGVMSNAETGGKGEIRISGESVGKMSDDSAANKSVSREIHFMSFPVIRDIIRESVLVETHADYLKNDATKRDNDSVNDSNLIVHRLYGAIEIDGNVYRVKTTLKEDISRLPYRKAYSYEITEIELLPGLYEDAVGSSRIESSSIMGAKLLKGVDKTKEPGVKILDESAKNKDSLIKSEQTPESEEENIRFRIREDEPPKRTGIGYKVFVLKNGNLYPPMVANPGGESTPVGIWLDADAAPMAGESKTGRPQVKAGGKGTQGGSGRLAYRPGWHLGMIPYALQFNRIDQSTGRKELFPANFVWAEVEYAADVDYQEEAMSYGYNKNGKFQHSYAGLPRVPQDGAYTYRTNPNPQTDPWIITGAMRVRRLLAPSEVDRIVREAGREPQRREAGAITDADIKALNNQYGINRTESQTDNPTTESDDVWSKPWGESAREKARQEQEASDLRSRMIEQLKKMAQALGIDVDIIEDSSALKGKKGRAKGWYDIRTGKVTVVVDNHSSVADIQKTFLHEVVAHHGLRKLFGAEFDSFLDMVYAQASDRIKEQIDVLATKNGWKRREATEEYLAALAEDTDFEAAQKSGWWSKVKSLFRDFLRACGFDSKIELTDNELRAVLWMSWKNLQQPGAFDSILGMAERVAKEYELKVGEYAGIENISIAGESGQMGPVYGEMSEQEMETTHEKATADKIERLFEEAVAGNLTGKPVEIGKLTTDGKSYLEKLSGTSMKDNVAFVLNPSDLVHMYRNHFGNNEKDKGNNIPLTKEDIREIANIIANPERIVFGIEPDGLKRKLFYFLSSAEDGAYNLLEIYGDRKGNLTAKTFYKTKKAVSQRALSLMKSEHLTSVTDGASLSGTKLPKLFEYPKSDESNYRFRDGDFTPRDVTVAASVYERMVARGSFQFQEAMQDSMLGLKALYQSILGKDTYIEDVAGYENAYLYENRMSSANNAEGHEYFTRYMKPLLKSVHELCGTKEIDRRILTDYMMAKHGLERNAYMRAQAVANKEKSDRDFAGLCGLTGETDWQAAEAKAQQMVDDYEQDHDTTELWANVKSATQATLTKLYTSGILSEKTFTKVLGMYDYYIPLRGWDETTSDEIYGYLTSKDGPLMGNVFKSAKGRDSKADDPIATIAMMADDAIRQGNRNIMKQRFLNFVHGHPSDLVSVNQLWLQYNDIKDEWEPVFADLTPDMTSDEVRDEISKFEAKMKALRAAHPDKYKRGRDAKNVPYKVVKGNISEHQVLVKRDGRTYVLTINGNPRAAQALNGLTNPDVDTEGLVGKLLRGGEYVNRQLSAFYTTRNPDFVVSNFLRDMIYANTMTWVKENPRYALRFLNNCCRFSPISPRRAIHLRKGVKGGTVYSVGMLLRKWESGTLDMGDKYERMFKEFMLNGGETGYTSVKDIEGHKRKIASELKKRSSVGRKAWSVLGLQLDLLNRSVENCARFAAFVTSREMGRSVDRSVYDAKEVSVNFNKKGSGGKFANAEGQTAAGNIGAYVGGLGRVAYVFWNAGIQGLTNFAKAGKRHPWKAVAGGTALFTMGYLIPMLAQLFGGGDGDDDDKNAYYNLPEYIRRSNICIKAGDQWITIPLPIEYRPMYGMGELMMGVISGNERYSSSELGMQIAGLVSQILPLDMLEGGGRMQISGQTNQSTLLEIISPFFPSAVKPFTEAYIMNKGWTGLPIYKDTPFNKNDPEWTKAYQNADQHLVDFTRWLNESTGGDDYTKGKIDINPAKLEYLINGTLGGMFSFPMKMKKGWVETPFGDREFEWSTQPLLNRVVKSGDDRTAYRKLQNDYFRYSTEARETNRRLKKYENAAEDGILGYAEKADFLYNSDEYLRYEILQGFKPEIDDLRTAISESTDKEVKKQLEKDMYSTMRQCVDALNEPEKYLKENGYER